MAEFAELKLNERAARTMFRKLMKSTKAATKRENDFIKMLAIYAFKDVIKHFKDEQGPDGPWADWSPMYAEHMAKIGKGGNNILQDNGFLRQSNVIGSGTTGVRKDAKGVLFFNSAKTKSGFPYAYAHDNDTAPRRRLPRRSFMWLSKDGLEAMAKATTKFLIKGI